MRAAWVAAAGVCNGRLRICLLYSAWDPDCRGSLCAGMVQKSQAQSMYDMNNLIVTAARVSGAKHANCECRCQRSISTFCA